MYYSAHSFYVRWHKHQKYQRAARLKEPRRPKKTAERTVLEAMKKAGLDPNSAEDVLEFRRRHLNLFIKVQIVDLGHGIAVGEEHFAKYLMACEETLEERFSARAA